MDAHALRASRQVHLIPLLGRTFGYMTFSRCAAHAAYSPRILLHYAGRARLPLRYGSAFVFCCGASVHRCRPFGLRTLSCGWLHVRLLTDTGARTTPRAGMLPLYLRYLPRFARRDIYRATRDGLHLRSACAAREHLAATTDTGYCNSGTGAHAFPPCPWLKWTAGDTPAALPLVAPATRSLERAFIHLTRCDLERWDDRSRTRDSGACRARGLRPSPSSLTLL